MNDIKFKRITAVFIAALFCLQTAVFASSGDPNIDKGGGSLQSGTSQNYWNSGDDGVRITAVDSETGAVKSASIDYTNITADNIRFHFGKVSKADYVNGTALSVSTKEYVYKTPRQKLPTIISDGVSHFADIDRIRSYFTDEQTVRGISEHMKIPFDELTNGDYKLMLEPIMYITYNGVRTAMTATEAALYNMRTGGDLISKFAPLSHKNLPLAMFLEKDDLGFKAWKGSTDLRVTDSDIIQYLGMGIVSFKETDENVEVTTNDYEYRTDTDVYTSVTVTGGEHTPDNPVTVKFYIRNKVYTVGNVVFPQGNSQLVWCKWHTPNTEQTVNIKVTATGGALVSNGNITAKIVDLDENPPPDPQADDRNDGFKAVSAPSNPQKTSALWSVWESYWNADWEWKADWKWENDKWVDRGKWADNGNWEFRSKAFSVSLSALMEITPDANNPTAMENEMKSGYGIREKIYDEDIADMKAKLEEIWQLLNCIRSGVLCVNRLNTSLMGIKPESYA